MTIKVGNTSNDNQIHQRGTSDTCQFLTSTSPLHVPLELYVMLLKVPSIFLAKQKLLKVILLVRSIAFFRFWQQSQEKEQNKQFVV